MQGVALLLLNYSTLSIGEAWTPRAQCFGKLDSHCVPVRR